MIGILAHTEKPAAASVVSELIQELTRGGLDYALEKRTAHLIGQSSLLDEHGLASCSDLLVVVGGDGTILRAVHKLPDVLPPIFGINIGSLGFLTCLGPSEIPRAVASIQRGDYILSQRPLLQARLHAEDGSIQEMHGLNDAVVSRGERSQLVKIRVLLDGTPLCEYNADGLVVATPTGSTAYSLSAGGPILLPDCGSFVITPICPHVLTNRSVVVSDQSVVQLQVASPNHIVFATLDGQDTCAMRHGDSLFLWKSERCLPLAMLPEKPFSEVLRQKLKWVGSNV